MAENSPPDPASLAEENAALKAKLADYKSLEEDLMAKRVFEKARGYLTTWITLGGIVLTLATFVGYKSVVGYFSDAAKKKADTITEDRIQTILTASLDKRVDDRVDKAMPQISELISKRIAQQSKPLAGASETVTTSGGQEQEHQEKPFIDWTADMAAPRNEGNESAAVGHALAATLEFYIFKSTGSHVVISARDIYNEVRASTRSLSIDGGAVIKDAINFLLKTGAVEERAWPYRAGEYAKPPPPSLANETRYKITDARQVVTLNDAKDALRSGPFVAGISIYESFSTEATMKTGLIPMPKRNDRTFGGIAICVVGYDDTKKMLKFSQCWGTDWGDHGYGYLPYDYFREQSVDCWTFRYAKP
jgi:C1A family cysteine protease